MSEKSDAHPKPHDTAVTSDAVEVVAAELVPDDGRRKIRDWPIPHRSAPMFTELYLSAPRFRQEVLRAQAVAQACRDAADMPSDRQLAAGDAA